MEKDKYYVINTKQFAELLLESGADVELKDNEGKTPLEYAYDYRSTDLKAIFSKYGAIDNYLEVIKKGFSHIPAKRAIFFNLIIKIYSLLGSNIKNSKKTAFLVGTLILLIIFYLFGYRSLGMIRIWGADSISTGIIISEKATSTTVNDVSVYKYYYKFKDKNNREFVNYSYTRGDRHHKNQKVKIEYLNSNPNFSILKDGWIGIIGNFFPFIFTLILLFVLIINFISFWIINNFFIVIKLLKKGIPVYAEIPIINSENSSNILYEYFDDINKVKKKGNIFTASDFVKNNHSVPCLYLPGNKHRSMLIAPDFINYKDNEWQIITNENLTKEGIKFFIVKLGISGLVFWFLYNLINYLINGV